MYFWSGIIERFILYWLFYLAHRIQQQIPKLWIQIVWPITISFPSLPSGLFFVKNKMNSWKLRIRSFIIGCWIRWARYLFGNDTFMIWKITTSFFPLLFSLNFSLFHDKIVVRVIRLRSAEQTANGKFFFPKIPKYCPRNIPNICPKIPKDLFYTTSLFVHLPHGFKDKKPKVESPTYLTFQSNYSYPPFTICMSNVKLS